jgi:hypothetical protein
MAEIKLYKSPWKALRLLALSMPFVAFALWSILKEDVGDGKALEWFTLCFFGLGVPISLFHLFDRRPQIIINEIGVFDRTIHTDFINWELILNAYPVNIYNQNFICLEVNNEFKPSKKKGLLYRRVARLNENMGFQEINLNLGQISIDADKLTKFILAMSNAESFERKEQLVLSQKSF